MIKYRFDINKLEYFATRPFTVQSLGTRVAMLSPCSKIFLSIPLAHNNRTIYVDKEGLTLYEEKIINEAIRSPKQHISQYNACIKELLNSAKKLAKEKNLKAYEKWIKSLSHYCLPCVMPFAIERIIEPLLRQELGKDYDNLTRPPKPNMFEKMRLDILNMVIEGDLNEARRLSGKYGWYSEYSYSESFLDEHYFISEASKVSIEAAQREKERITKRNSVTVNIKDKRLRQMAWLAHAYTYLRTDRVDKLKKAQAIVREFYAYIAKKIGWDYETILLFSNEEIVRFLKQGILPETGNLKKRKSPYVYYHDSTSHFIYGKEAKMIINELNKSLGRDIKGKCAFPGCKKGLVRIVNSLKEIPSFPKGYILVAPHTMPSYMQAIQNSAAMITDEGGMTSHAAIVARELRKPCIVGAGNATKMLKDGDLVEVDADKGIVRKVRG